MVKFSALDRRPQTNIWLAQVTVHIQCCWRGWQVSQCCVFSLHQWNKFKMMTVLDVEPLLGALHWQIPISLKICQLKIELCQDNSYLALPHHSTLKHLTQCIETPQISPGQFPQKVWHVSRTIVTFPATLASETFGFGLATPKGGSAVLFLQLQSRRSPSRWVGQDWKVL